ncbi:MAG: universal stress protein [Desulfovibrio sp.]|uniref:universal stress protein n=1 Tax=Desulfovibrio sp. TaxID=885 RepID=UPI0039E3339F
MDYSSILVPVDGSEDAKFACRVAAQLAGAIPGKETIHLLHCHEPIPILIGGEQRKTLMRRHEEETAQFFSDASSAFATSDITIQTYLKYGSIAKTIINTASELGCSMIIMGTRGRSELTSMVIGSVSHDVLRHATMPVLLVNKKFVATDD